MSWSETFRLKIQDAELNPATRFRTTRSRKFSRPTNHNSARAKNTGKLQRTERDAQHAARDRFRGHRARSKVLPAGRPRRAAAMPSRQWPVQVHPQRCQLVGAALSGRPLGWYGKLDLRPSRTSQDEDQLTVLDIHGGRESNPGIPMRVPNDSSNRSTRTQPQKAQQAGPRPQAGREAEGAIARFCNYLHSLTNIYAQRAAQRPPEAPPDQRRAGPGHASPLQTLGREQRRADTLPLSTRRRGRTDVYPSLVADVDNLQGLNEIGPKRTIEQALRAQDEVGRPGGRSANICKHLQLYNHSHKRELRNSEAKRSMRRAG